MAELKTKKNDADVNEFIDSFANTEQKRKDSYELVKLMQEVSGFEPKMWGDSMIGFGQYHYKSERSSQEGDWMLIGFSPRKTAISLLCLYGLRRARRTIEGFREVQNGKRVYICKETIGYKPRAT